MRTQNSLVVEYNNSSAPYPSGKTIAELFVEQVGRTPDDEAVRLGERALSYRELNGRANQVAARLRASGVGQGHLVALVMDHSIEVVCAILGVLKTGAAYVPVDPGTPRERLAQILRDIADGTGISQPVVVAGSRLADGVPLDLAKVVVLNERFAAVESYGPDEVASPASPGDLAYVIFTSGSTGKPKGVMIEHRSLVNYIWWAKKVYAQGEPLCWPLFSSLAFDLTVTSIFTPLISGGRIVAYADQDGMPATLVLRVVEDGIADIIKLTPAHLAMIKNLDLRRTCIRRLIVGGEDFKTALAHEVTERFGRPVQLFNEYGPTEATVGCMIHCYDAPEDQDASVPIGRPADNSSIFILDADLCPVSVGVIGEMYLAGDGLARGYFNRPELTAAAFVTANDPRGTGKSVRLYKTGDLARWSADGRMEFLGRSDHQVKIGGFRIELGEIEARLLAFPGIRECVSVVVHQKGAAETGEIDIARLAAYYVSDAPLPVADLRAHLAAELPHYMIPAHFTRLEALPLTSNGKVDRNALPVPTETERAETTAAAPRTDAERALAKIWSDLLHTEGIGPDSDFFDLGGHSLLAIKVASRLRDVFRVDVKIQVLFEHTTLAALAAAVTEAQEMQDTARPAMPIIRQVRRAARLA